MTVYNDPLSEYITSIFALETQALQETRQFAKEKGLPEIHIKPEEGRFLQFLTTVTGARKAVEIGTLGGYSTTWLATGLPQEGKLISLEMDLQHARIARKNLETTGVLPKVEIRVGDAHQLLADLEPESPFDLVFIDAEKEGYPAYYAWAIEHLRIGGVVAAHNAFRGGSVLNPDSDHDRRAAVIDRFNREVARDKRVLSTIFPAGDGTLIAVKISS